MKRYNLILIACIAAAAAAWEYDLCACTSILVSRGASKDGSVMITYACDGEFHPHLRRHAAADHEPGSFYEIVDWSGNLRGKIAQPAHTYSVVGLMNEHQVAIGETTFDGRMELQNPDGLLHYWTLMQLALQRAKTAREAVEVIADLVEEHGYGSTGESISIADPDEAWLLEIIGTGPGGKGAVWVALRVPDGYVCCTANRARISTFPRNDTENCLHSENVISFATEKGFYEPGSGKPFSFCDAYCPATPQRLRYCSTRVWSIFRRCAPSQEFPIGYHRGDQACEPYPLWIKPDEKLGIKDVMDLMRDHYEGTPFDMTKGVDSGPFGTPNRWRPMTWSSQDNEDEHSWERPISTQQTGFSFVSQSRSWLPDPIGGVYWYGLDDTYTTCYIPLYCGISDVPPSYTSGSLQKFSWESAWWVFNFAANYANLKYSYMIKDIQKVQAELEGELLAAQAGLEKEARALLDVDRERMAEFLTGYCVDSGEKVVKRWRELGEELMTRYNDGYVKDENGRPQEKGYPKAWLKDVLELRPEQFLLEKWNNEKTETELPF